jgi:hypothetical protein
MIAKTPEERMRYEARLKAERDHHQQLLDAEERGEARGRKNTLAEEIQRLQAVLVVAVTPLEELIAQDLAPLEQLHDELFARILARPTYDA